MRVWVTRDERNDSRLARSLLAAGLEPIAEPVVMITTIGDARDAISRLSADDWLVLTSERAIHAVAQDEARVPRVAVVGKRSADEATKRDMRVEYISPSGESTQLWKDLGERLAGSERRICYPRSSLARVPNPKELPGVTVDAPVIYRVEPREFDHSVVDRVDVTAFTSASAVDAVDRALGHIPRPAASIGPHTSEAIRRASPDSAAPDIQAAEPSFESLATAIQAYSRRHHRA